MVDIFNTPVKTTINRTLSGLSINIVGKPKVGKTTFAASFSKPIFLCTENGISNIIGITPIPIASWGDFKSAVSQLAQVKAREMFDTVVIDSMTNLLLLLDKYTGSKMSTEKTSCEFGSELEFGKGSRVMRNELGIQLQKLTNQGYTVVSITHAEDKVDFDSGRSYIGTSLSNSIYGTLEKFVDMTVYLDRQEDKKTHEIKYLTHFTPKGGFAGTGGRFSPKQDSIPTDFHLFEQAMIEAMNEQANKIGAIVVEEQSPQMTIDVKENGDLDLVALKNEFDELTKTLIEQNKENITKIQSVIANVLGPNKKVAALVNGQEELLVEIINLLKN